MGSRISHEMGVEKSEGTRDELTSIKQTNGNKWRGRLVSTQIALIKRNHIDEKVPIVPIYQSTWAYTIGFIFNGV